MLAVFLYARSKVESEIPLFRSWLRRYVKNWAHCDAVGMELLAEFVSWTDAPELWVRRGGMVAFMRSGRLGLYGEVTEALVEKGRRDPELYVRTAAEWLERQRR